MDEKDNKRTKDRQNDKEIADNIIKKSKQDILQEEQKLREYHDKLKKNCEVVETQMKFKEEYKPKVMNETEEKINKDLLYSLKNRNLL